MNRLPASDTCGVCARNLLGEHRAAHTVAERHDLARQIFSGICDLCQRARQAAAIQYERAAAGVRLAELLGSGRTRNSRTPAVQQAMFRMEAADRRCIELKMWPATRTTKRPSTYYREGPSWATSPSRRPS